MKLVLTTYLYNEGHCVEYMLKSVIPFVDGAYVLIDDKTDDRTAEICLDYGCKIKYFSFENFGKIRNTSLAWVKEESDWHILLGGDETLDVSSGPILRPTIIKAAARGVECVGPLRVEWENLEMSGQPFKKRNAPTRISKSSEYPRLHAKRYFHARLHGCKNFETENTIIINHFRHHWANVLNKNPEDKKDFYKHLKELRIKEKNQNLWPD